MGWGLRAAPEVLEARGVCGAARCSMLRNTIGCIVPMRYVAMRYIAGASDTMRIGMRHDAIRYDKVLYNAVYNYTTTYDTVANIIITI